MKKSLLLFAVVLMFVAGCSKSAPTIDTSSDKAMKASLQRVLESLPVEKQAKFQSAVMLITISGLTPAEMSAEDGAARSMERLKERLDGKTGEEVIAEAEKIKEKLGR
jgi:PBP1b-binding outer membrane lipoprotein LpoB